MKRPENQTIPVATKTDAFVYIPEQVTGDKNIFIGMNVSIYTKWL